MWHTWRRRGRYTEVLLENHKGGASLSNLGVDGSVKKWLRWRGFDVPGTLRGLEVGCCEYGNEPSPMNRTSYLFSCGSQGDVCFMAFVSPRAAVRGFL